MTNKWKCCSTVYGNDYTPILDMFIQSDWKIT